MAIGRRDIPVIDSHIHLYPGSESHSIAWLTPDSSLNGQWSVDQYRNATKATNSLQGFVVVEAGRKHDLDSGQCDGSGWSGPLQEVSWLCRVALGEPRPGEGHGIQDSKLCLAIIPWAPIPSGPAVLERYLGRVKEVSGSVWPKIRGFRYLLQDKPCGTSRKKDFVESLKLLARGGLLFEICVDQHRRGHSQLHDAVALLQLSTAGVTHSNLATVVIDHFLKPDLTASADPSHPSFKAWASAIASLADFPKTYIKISGAFSETSEEIRGLDLLRVAEFLQPWFRTILDAFGPRRMLFGSDWPVCTEGLGDSWDRWRQVVENMCLMEGLSGCDVARIFSGTAREVYGI